MSAIDTCPVCGGEVQRKTVEKLLRGGAHTAVVTLEADVCLKCGERMYDPQTIRLFEDIRTKLGRNETEGLTPIGQSFQIERRAS